MWNKGIVTIAVLCVVALTPLAHAQTTGNIRGLIEDAAGGILPGVTVTVEGESLIGGQRSAVTGASGTYSFVGLPPGNYAVTAALAGFQTQRTENVRVNINATASVDFALPQVFSEEVMVIGETPLVDTANPGLSSNYDADFIENLPTARNFWDLMAVSPGISQASEASDRQVAFGGNVQSNSWNIDGLDTTASDTGSSWWYINPDTIEEVQVMGVGAPAEFGQMLGAAFNVVTKSGSNEFHGGVNAYFQTDSLTDTNVELEDSEWPSFHRDKLQDISVTLGGPIVRDRLWFFVAAQYWRDASSPPGVNPDFAPSNYSDRYDAKLTAQVSTNNRIDAKFHYEDWGFPEQGSQYVTPSALGIEAGYNPGWGIIWQSILSDRTVFEAKYTGWTGPSSWESQTGSTEDPFVEWNPPGGGPETYSGGAIWPYEYDLDRDQFDVSLSHFADDFLAGDHEFKFGVQYNKASAETAGGPGPRGVYYYHYVYEYDYYGTIYEYEYFGKYINNPFYYGNEQDALSAYVDDSWRVNDKVTLRLGVRYDKHDAWIPDYPVLDVDWNPTGETLEGVDNAVDWTHFSPRLGFTWTPNPKTIIRGSAGVYYDANVSGNWNYPPPGAPPIEVYYLNEETGEYDIFGWDSQFAYVVDPDLVAPRSLQYSLGFEQQIGSNIAIGAQVVYKDTEDLIGWENMGDGRYEEFPFTDPFTGNEYILWNQIRQATYRKGNEPGVTANPNANEYWQEYSGLLLTFKKRMSHNWSMMGSYTLSESKGLIPRMLQDYQFNPFYYSTEGADPNNYINAEQLLQGDRRHMLNLQATFLLPWGMNAGTMVTLQSGRAYSRQTDVWLEQGRTTVIMEPGNDGQRFPSQAIIDLSLGKGFNLGGGVLFNVDLQLYNLLNDDAWDYWENLSIQEGERFVPDAAYYMLPRRLQIRVGVEF
jgi:outer membrane receptor protein involved in Fe transport